MIADNQWHKYQWFLDRDDDSEAWLEGNSGTIDGLNVSLDSIQFTGATDSQIYLDDVFWDPQAVPESTAAIYVAVAMGFAASFFRRRQIVIIA